MTVLVAHEVVRYLKGRGVTEVFGLCGRTVIAILEALSGSEQIEFVNIRHEQIVSHATSGYAGVTHRVLVVLIYPRSGLTNTATGVANVTLNSIPVVVITGDTPTHYSGKHPRQKVNHHASTDQWQIYRPFVKRAFRVERAELLPEILDRVFVIAESGRPGPVLVDVLMDLFSLPIEAALVDRVLANHIDYALSAFDVAIAERIVISLAAAEHPLVYAGGGVLSACASGEPTTLVDLPDLLVAHSLMGKGAVSDDNPHVLGTSGSWGTPFTNQMCRGVDWILGLGTRFAEADSLSRYEDFTFRMPSMKLIQIGIDPEQIGRNHLVEIGTVADPKPAFTTFLEAVRRLYPRGVMREGVTGTILAERVACKEALVVNQTSGEPPMNPVRILKDPHDHTPADSFVVTNVSWNENGPVQQYDISVPGTFIIPGGFAAMGFGSLVALGAQLAAPGHRVIAPVGNGGFGQDPVVLATARRGRIPVVWVVMNNNAYETTASLEKADYGTTFGTVFESKDDDMWLDHSAIAAAYGIWVRKVTSPEDLGVALDEVLVLGEPHLIDAPMRNIPTPTGGHWNILDIYNPDGVKGHMSIRGSDREGEDMPHHYSLTCLTVGDPEPSAQIYVAAAAGYEYVGLRPIPMGLLNEPRSDLPHDRDLLEARRAALAETGVRVWDIELARAMASINYDSYLPVLEVGAELGAITLLASVWTEGLGEQMNGLGCVAELAGRFGLRVVVEFVASSAIRIPGQMFRLVREVGAPNPGILTDAYHWMRAGASLVNVAAPFSQRSPMLHLCDCSSETPPGSEMLWVEVRECRLYVGEGDVPIPVLVAALPADATLTIEQSNLARLHILGGTEYATWCLVAARATIPV